MMGNRQQVTQVEERPLQKIILDRPVLKYPTRAHFMKVRHIILGTKLHWFDHGGLRSVGQKLLEKSGRGFL